MFMADQQTNDPNQRSHQQGAPQNTQDMPSSGNSPKQSGGTDEGVNRNSDVERPGGGTPTRTSPQTGGYGGAGETTGDPGRTPGKAEGVEEPEDNGNQ
jgi:hypothetical protein